MLGSLAAVAVSFSVLLFFLLGPSGSSSERDRESSRRAGLLLVSENGKLSLENASRPAVGPEMRGCGMRQLPVMSPQAFLGYEFSPAAAGRALALSASSLLTPNTRKHLRCSRPCRDGPTTTLLRRKQGFFMCRFWFSRAAAVLNSGWVCLPANPGDQPPRREVFGQLLQMAENHPAPEQLR